jgi:outer membrane protein OmpA-like peptidoglycan-associated protein
MSRVCAIAGVLWLCLSPGFSRAADPPDPQPVMSGDAIAQALRHPVTRGFTPRGLTRRDTEPAQSVNLNVPFARNSSTLQPQAEAQLNELRAALTSPFLRKDRFVIAGHTDGKGDPGYNKSLSLRRAETVKRFLVANGVDASRLQTAGFGAEQLLTPDDPGDPRNRRVEVRDLGEASP